MAAEHLAVYCSAMPSGQTSATVRLHRRTHLLRYESRAFSHQTAFQTQSSDLHNNTSNLQRSAASSWPAKLSMGQRLSGQPESGFREVDSSKELSSSCKKYQVLQGLQVGTRICSAGLAQCCDLQQEMRRPPRLRPPLHPLQARQCPAPGAVRLHATAQLKSIIIQEDDLSSCVPAPCLKP